MLGRKSPLVIKRLVSAVALLAMMSACSTNGEMYKEGDAKNGEFSVWRTLALPFAVAGVVVGAAAVGAAAAEPTYSYQRPVHCSSTRYGRTVYTNCY